MYCAWVQSRSTAWRSNGSAQWDSMPVPACVRWTRRLLHGTELSHMKPAKCVKEPHSLAEQHTNTHRQFMKLCWLMDKHALSCRTRDQHRRDVIPSLASADDRVVPSRRQTSPVADQHNSAHDIHSRLQHGSWPTEHVGADPARWQHRRRLAGGTLAAARVPRHIGERLGNHDDAAAAHGHTGRRDEPRHGKTIVDPSLEHGQHPRQRSHPGRHEGRFRPRRAVLHSTTKHVVPAALRPGRLSRLQELHPDASEHHSCPLCHRRLIRRRRRDERSKETPVSGRMGFVSIPAVSATKTRRGQLGRVACEHATPLHSAMPCRKATALHTHDELFSMHIEPEPAEEDRCGVGHG